MNCPRCDRPLKQPEMFSNPKGVGWKIACSCGLEWVSDTYENFVKVGLAMEIIK